MRNLFPVLLLGSLTSFGSFSYGVESSEKDALPAFLDSSSPLVTPSIYTSYSAGVVAINFPVPVLYFHGRPPAIINAVNGIVINPVEGMTFWARPHVFIEISEVQPPITDSNSSTPVVVESLVVRVSTPLNHVRPALVFWRVGHAVCSSVVYNTFSHVDSLLINVVRVGGADTPSVHYKQPEDIV